MGGLCREVSFVLGCWSERFSCGIVAFLTVKASAFPDRSGSVKKSRNIGSGSSDAGSQAAQGGCRSARPRLVRVVAQKAWLDKRAVDGVVGWYAGVVGRGGDG